MDPFFGQARAHGSVAHAMEQAHGSAIKNMVCTGTRQVGGTPSFRLRLSDRVFTSRRRFGAELLQFSHRPRHRRTGAAGPQARSAEGQAVVVAPASGTVARVSLLR